jgi:hypothetical protein
MTKKRGSLIPKTKNSPDVPYNHRQSIIQFQARSSILPPADELAAYEKLHPGITERLLTSYEKQQEHRMIIEKNVITGAVRRTYRGQVFAFLLGLIAICGGLGLLFLGKSIIGLSVLIGAVASLIGIFIYGKESNKKHIIAADE